MKEEILESRKIQVKEENTTKKTSQLPSKMDRSQRNMKTAAEEFTGPKRNKQNAVCKSWLALKLITSYIQWREYEKLLFYLNCEQ